ncbi:hypothetical protein IMSAG192_00960 [Muribaculaceae bacterium]|nr:hypothetical protein IMSAG192_00960 [Muribaculaceae bacterium]
MAGRRQYSWPDIAAYTPKLIIYRVRVKRLSKKR